MDAPSPRAPWEHRNRGHTRTAVAVGARGLRLSKAAGQEALGALEAPRAARRDRQVILLQLQPPGPRRLQQPSVAVIQRLKQQLFY